MNAADELPGGGLLQYSFKMLTLAGLVVGGVVLRLGHCCLYGQYFPMVLAKFGSSGVTDVCAIRGVSSSGRRRHHSSVPSRRARMPPPNPLDEQFDEQSPHPFFRPSLPSLLPHQVDTSSRVHCCRILDVAARYSRNVDDGGRTSLSKVSPMSRFPATTRHSQDSPAQDSPRLLRWNLVPSFLLTVSERKEFVRGSRMDCVKRRWKFRVAPCGVTTALELGA